MARIRTIKPEFFRHEGLQDLQAEHTAIPVMLVFAALWGHCDKNGTFEWRPRQLKLDILPFLPFSMEQALALLADAGFVDYFEADGKPYGNIPTFQVHQRVGGKEATEPERFPKKPPGTTGEALGKQLGSSGEAVGKQRGSTGDEEELQEGKGREREGEGIVKGDKPPSPKPRKRGSALPDDFQISDRVKSWAQQKGWGAYLEAHLEHFRGYCAASGKTYVDHDEAFMNAIRADWGGIRRQASGPPQAVVPRPAAQAPADAIVAEIRRADALKTPMPDSIRNFVKGRLAA